MVPSIMEPKRNTIAEFWNGCELNPRIFSIFDVKLIYYRMAILGTILLLTAYVHEDAWNLIRNVLYGEATDYNSTLILVTALNIFFHLDLVFHEKQLTATFEIQNEGTGFMLLLKDNLYPFVTAFPVKYILYRNIRAPSIALAFIIGMFFVGYLLFRYNNNMKYAVRINPADYRINYKDLYITFSGKKLLLAKTWGFVRHPNYLGHIIVLVTFSFALLWSAPFNVISFLPLIIRVIFLLHRAARDGRQCEKKHGASWTRYCNVVKYKIVPHIY
ncbi:delta(14)-sterol reductase-like [Ctenocephalides felis]|uniref:delta(14)-sterol reductase-like n=1 Tax=Ctenocephalides felis TaxID=7515 RepID=UPI000E6E24E5|nr:delta(14)-sterol reductase-like [Ctenocephalides felis]